MATTREKNLAKFKKQRNAIRTNVKKQIKIGNELLAKSSAELDLEALCIVIETVERYERDFTELDDKIQDTIDKEEDLDVDIEESMDFRTSVIDKISAFRTRRTSIESTLKEERDKNFEGEKIELKRALLKMEQKKLELEEQKMERMERTTKEHAQRKSHLNLPKLDIQTFDGDLLRWKEFWDSYSTCIDDNVDLSNIEKFTYLKSKLSGEAHDSISGLELSNENYPVALSILKDRFGNKQTIINLHYTKLMEVPPSTSQVDKLRSMRDTIEKHLRSLKAYGEDIDQQIFVSIITSKLPKDILLQLELQKGCKQEWTVQNLRDLLNNLVSAKESAEQFNHFSSLTKTPPVSNSQQSRKTPFRPSTEALASTERNQSNPKRAAKKCVYCEKEHWSDECRTYKTIPERKNRIKGRCFVCFSSDHLLKECHVNKLCIHCNTRGNHHRSLCPRKFNLPTREPTAVITESITDPRADECTENMLITSEDKVIMQTAKAKVHNPVRNQTMVTRILLDTGSYRSYITQDLANLLKLKETEKERIYVSTFGTKKPQVILTSEATLDLELIDGSYLPISVNIVPEITGTMQRVPLNEEQARYVNLHGCDLSDTLITESETININLLIGSDYYSELILPGKIQIQPGLYLLESSLGWIVAGRTSNGKETTAAEPSMFVMTHTTDPVPELQSFSSPDSSLNVPPPLEKFWNLESIGITDPIQETTDDVTLEYFNNTIQLRGGRYHVKWPWKEKDPDLPSNRELAQGRLQSLARKLQKTPELMEKYNTIIENQLEQGIIEKVDQPSSENESTVHYIPHHAVITPQKTTTKIRVVYDASAKTRKDSSSLNECLNRGPVILQDLCGLLMRFRTHHVALVADIEKAFLQIGLQDEDRDVTRFFWLRDITRQGLEGNIDTYRFCRVPFGVISSPFLLAATISYHLKKYDTPEARQLLKDLYVDNVITGTNTVDSAIDFHSKAKRLFEDALMNLREWNSNSSDLMNELPVKDRSSQNTCMVLGTKWNTVTDELSIQGPKEDAMNVKLSKRHVLHRLSTIFDPMGMFTPVTLEAKLFLQSLWKDKVDWDKKLDEEKGKLWSKLDYELQQISSHKLPRCVTLKDESSDYQLHCFCDASGGAYAAAVFLRGVNNSGITQCHLIFSKCRLAPLRVVSIPRLELLGVLIGVRALEFISKEIQLSISSKVVWTDSQCVLKWLSTTKPLSVFVENRVKEIKSRSDISFRYVPGSENIADIATRVTSFSRLLSIDSWWFGPRWLSDSEDKWPVWNLPNVNPDVSELIKQEMRKTKVMYEAGLAANNEKPDKDPALATPFGIDNKKYSSLYKLLRVTAFAMRFIKALKGTNYEKGHLSSKEISDAKLLWESLVQRNHYQDVFEAIEKNNRHQLQEQLNITRSEDGLLRCHGRLENSDLTEGARSPKLLPRKDHFTKLTIEAVHKRCLHAGVSQTLATLRQEYWVPKGRMEVRNVLNKCLICTRYEGGPYKMPKMPHLPKERVSKSTPFNFTGLDYLGPIYIRTTEGVETKIWVCLFTCLTVRAVQLELVTDMTAEEFLLCLRRFIASHGKPQKLISDNASQFKLAKSTLDKIWRDVITDEDVRSYTANQGIDWVFITEFAPWMGGYYERLVGLVKRSLRKCIGRASLTTIQLQTFLKEVEAIINNRPLVHVYDDINSDITLTPSHFLSLNPKTGIPESEVEVDDGDYQGRTSSSAKLMQVWKKGQRQLNNFWRIWMNEYLTSLRERKQAYLKGPRTQSCTYPAVGDVVIVREKGVSRGCWKIGKITSLKTSEDDEIRSAEVQLPSKRMIRRPLNQLYPLEVSSKERQENEETQPKVLNNPQCTRQPRQAALKARAKIKNCLNNYDT